MIGEVRFTEDVESRDVAHEVVVYPEPAHCVVDGGEDSHWALVGVLISDLLVHVEEIAVTLLDGVPADALDGVGEVEVDAETGGADAASVVARFLRGAGGNIARGEVAKARVFSFEEVVAVLFGDLAGILLGIFLLRYLNRTIKQTKQWHTALGLFGLLGLGFVSLGVLNAGWLNKIDALTPIIDRLPNQLVPIPGQASDGIHPNQIAGTLLFYLPLLWSVLLGRNWRKHTWQKWLWLGLALLGTAVLLLTQSRSGWLGGLGAVGSLLLLWTLSLPRGSRQQRQLLMLLGLLIIGGIVTLSLIGPERLISLWQDPAQETAVGSLSSLSFRQEVWRWTIVAIQDFPFTGIGLGSFRRVIRRLYPLGITPSYDVAHAHNIYLHTAVDIGLPGLIIYLALLGLVIYLGWLAAQRSKPLRPYALGLIAGVIGFHIYGIGDVLALGSKTALSFWFLLGLITTLHQITQPPIPKQP